MMVKSYVTIIKELDDYLNFKYDILLNIGNDKMSIIIYSKSDDYPIEHSLINSMLEKFSFYFENRPFFKNIYSRCVEIKFLSRKKQRIKLRKEKIIKLL